MANAEHLERLRAGVDSWNQWRKEDNIVVDLTEANLPNIRLAGVNLSGAKLFRADFAGAHLDGASFKQARLAGANFFAASLKQVDFSWLVWMSLRSSAAT